MGGVPSGKGGRSGGESIEGAYNNLGYDIDYLEQTTAPERRSWSESDAVDGMVSIARGAPTSGPKGPTGGETPTSSPRGEAKRYAEQEAKRKVDFSKITRSVIGR